MWVCYVKKEFAGSNERGPRVRQRNVNYACWNIILIVALEDDKRVERGLFRGRPRSERVFYYHRWFGKL